MKKKILSAIIILAMTMSACMVAIAAENPSATKSGLHSRGAIKYSQGENSVFIDSADLYTLADQLDSFKMQVAEQLGKMRTYLSRAGSGVPLTSADGVCVVRRRPNDSEAVDPLSLDFSAIVESIAVSQIIPTDPVSYGMSSSTILYKTPEGRLSTTSSEGAEPIDIREATPNNLSAGTAAWVNGRLLLGTGADVANGRPTDVGGEEPLAQYDISSGYTVPEDIKTAFVYIYNVGSGSNDAAQIPVFSMNGGGAYDKLYERNYSRNAFNIKVALYHLRNIPQGTVVEGSNGVLFY